MLLADWTPEVYHSLGWAILLFTGIAVVSCLLAGFALFLILPNKRDK